MIAAVREGGDSRDFNLSLMKSLKNLKSTTSPLTNANTTTCVV
jgi:hypothetical protein